MPLLLMLLEAGGQNLAPDPQDCASPCQHARLLLTHEDPVPCLGASLSPRESRHGDPSATTDAGTLLLSVVGRRRAASLRFLMSGADVVESNVSELLIALKACSDLPASPVSPVRGPMVMRPLAIVVLTCQMEFDLKQG